jgi:uncharacterized protein YggE
MRLWPLFLLLATTLSCQAEDLGGTAPALISVSGEGSVTATPDMAMVNVGVTTQAQDASDAVAANNRAMAELGKVLDDFGIAERDRKTSNFNIYPRYDHGRNGDRAPQISSYEVSNQLTIRVRQVDRLGELLNAVVKSGSNRIGSLSFANADDAALRDEARQLAVKDAKHKAALYAEAAGGKLGRIVSISEAGAAQPRPLMNARMMMADAESVPVSAGENEIREVVNVVYEFEP